MNRILMYWYKIPNGDSNFGDEIGPYIVSKLSGLKPILIKPNKKIINRKLVNSIFKKQDNYSFKDLYKILTGKKRILVTAGSILNHYNLSSCDIWGSGIIKKNEKVHNAKFYAVRGKYSQIRLKELGYSVSDSIGDPALLLPIVLPKKSHGKKYKLGIIPHYIHYKKVVDMIGDDKIQVINLLDSIEEVVEQINTCEFTISSSMHGIIVSHAYNVPSLWYQLDEKPLYGDDIKFDDYFSSVGIKNYKPFLLPEISKTNDFIDSIEKTINSNRDINSIQFDLKQIHKKLIDAAPFPIKEKFITL